MDWLLLLLITWIISTQLRELSNDHVFSEFLVRNVRLCVEYQLPLEFRCQHEIVAVFEIKLIFCIDSV